MNRELPYCNLTVCKELRPYIKETLSELAERIATSGDKRALDEFHNHRTPFQVRGSGPINFMQYVEALFNETWFVNTAAHFPEVFEQARDLVVDRFTCIPPEDGESSVTHSHTDCRYYFAAFAKYAKTQIDPESSKLNQEVQSARILQTFVTRHSHFSCLECKRQSQKLTRRYNWKIGDHVLVIWIPYEVPGSRCKSWLKENIPDVDPVRPGERHRVQAIVDQLLTRRQIFSLDAMNGEAEHIAAPASTVSTLIEEELAVTTLSDVVASEKATNITCQRPAIQRLGPDRLEKMIHHVFESVLKEHVTEAQIAQEFGLSTPTFSRFAGRRWSNGTHKIVPANVPDLWKNTAHILANHPQFMDTARQSASWGPICAAQGIENRNRRGVAS